MSGHPDHRGDGDGWVECARGHRHWGRFGAAGLLAHRTTPAGTVEVLLQHRAAWSHHGGTWGLLGGARQSSESAVVAAVREAGEEGGLAPEQVRVQGRYDEAHGGWTYTTVLAAGASDLSARPTGRESIDVAWHPAGALDRLDLHPGFAAAWPALREALAPLQVVVDAANVVGSVPDGWWRDRAGAARRLVGRCRALATLAGVPDVSLPSDLSRAALAHWWPEVTVVVEGAARVVADDPLPAVPAGTLRGGLQVVAAPGSGDDAVVDAARRVVAGGGPVVVVTADRGLAGRVRALPAVPGGGAGATVTGPRWLLTHLP